MTVVRSSTLRLLLMLALVAGSPAMFAREASALLLRNGTYLERRTSSIAPSSSATTTRMHPIAAERRRTGAAHGVRDQLDVPGSGD